MSIEVRCPNPACGKTHEVKTKYAGMRGKCPACGGWMMIPKVETLAITPPPAPPPHSSTPPNLTLDEATVMLGPTEQGPEPARSEKAPRPRPPEEDDATVVEAFDDEPPRKPRSASDRPKKRPRYEEEGADVIDAEVDDEDTVSRKPRQRFSWLVCVLLFVASLGLGAGSLAAHLDGPSASATGPLQKSMRQVKPWLPEEYGLATSIVPGALALLGIVGMMVAMGTHNFGIVPLLTTYLGTFTAVAVLALAVTGTFNTKKAFADLDREAQRLGKENKVELKTALGAGVQVALIGETVALVLFWVSLLLMHRHTLGRILCVVFVVFACGGAGIMVFTTAELPPGLGGS